MRTPASTSHTFHLIENSKMQKYLQLAECISIAIKQGKLRKGDKIFSINELSNECFLSRDTVQKAYNSLVQQGVIKAIQGKGYYVNRTDIGRSYRILLLFNKISNYKKEIYDSFIHALGENAFVDLKIHHSNIRVFEDLIMDNLNEYDFFVVMPHFYEHASKAHDLISRIPIQKLIILDKDLTHIEKNYTAVYQDFKNDIVEALDTGLTHLKKYNNFFLVFPKLVPYPPEIVVGFKNFCMQNRFCYNIIPEIQPASQLIKGSVYIVIEETDLVQVIKKCRAQKLKPGRDIGIISYNETPLKEILLDGITVLSTDHAKMGQTAAALILENRQEKIKNPFTLTIRKSL